MDDCYIELEIVNYIMARTSYIRWYENNPFLPYTNTLSPTVINASSLKS